MNWRHLRTFLWLRWRLRISQLKRSGIANNVILAILAAATAASAVFLFIVFLGVGLFTLNDVDPAWLMYLLDGMIALFLFTWAIGLLSELQRSEALSLEKFLHLPVSLSTAFLINYVSSLPSVSLLWFLSAGLGLTLGLILSRGWAMLWLAPMLAAFLLMVTALTYQFQGWLATLMTNPRRRRTIIFAATMFFILLLQVPNLVNILRPWETKPDLGPKILITQELRELERDFRLKKVTDQEYFKRKTAYDKRRADILSTYQAQKQKEAKEQFQQREQAARLLNLLVPPGWLAAGGEAAAEGWPWPVVLAILGPTLIGTASLYRAYRTTMRLYTGQYTTGLPVRSAGKSARQPLPALRTGKSSLLERKLPFLSEPASVIALAGFRSLLRAPEAKILLLSPVLLLAVFGSMFLTTGRADMPDGVRPLIGFSAMVVVLFSMSNLLGNQFGFDRDGFRVFVLSPARRRDILLGKNLAIAPIALVMGAAAAVLVQAIYPMRLDQFLALAPRFVSMYLIYCLVANTLSILAPLRIAAGSFQPAKPKGFVILLHTLFLFFCPGVLGLTLLPFFIDSAVEVMGWRHGVPLDLLLSLAECAVIMLIYGLFLGLQGDWLQAREQRILQTVTTRTE